MVIVPVYWTRMIMSTDFRFSNQTILSTSRLSARRWSAVNNNNNNTYIIILLYLWPVYDIKQIRFMRQRSPKTSHRRRRTAADCRWSIRQGVYIVCRPTIRRDSSNETWLYVRLRPVVNPIMLLLYLWQFDLIFVSYIATTKTGSLQKSVIFTIVFVSFWIYTHYVII